MASNSKCASSPLRALLSWFATGRPSNCNSNHRVPASSTATARTPYGGRDKLSPLKLAVWCPSHAKPNEQESVLPGHWPHWLLHTDATCPARPPPATPHGTYASVVLAGWAALRQA